MKIADFAPSYIAQISKLSWKPINRSVWNTIQDEGLDEEYESYESDNWVMADLKVDPRDAEGLQRFDSDTVEEFNRFDIALKSQYPGLIDLIDYDAGTITIVRTK
jgi:hypothetical protein